MHTASSGLQAAARRTALFAGDSAEDDAVANREHHGLQAQVGFHFTDPGQQAVQPDAERANAHRAVGQFLDALDIGPDLLDIRDGPSGHVCPPEARP